MISGIFWNIRGVAKAPNLRRLIKLVRTHHVQFVVICEPKLDESKIESIRLRLLFDHTFVNNSGDIWVFYSSPFVCSIVGNSEQHILYTFKVSCFLLQSSCLLSMRSVQWRSVVSYGAPY